MTLALHPDLDSQAQHLESNSNISSMQEAAPDTAAKGDLGEQVRAVLDAKGLEQVGLRPVAQELAMSTRTLERKLAALGLTFNGVVDAYRREKALWLLRHTESSMEQIATELGFCGAKNFSRTFRRWYGSTPSRMRKGGPTAGHLVQGAVYQGTTCST